MKSTTTNDNPQKDTIIYTKIPPNTPLALYDLDEGRKSFKYYIITISSFKQ